MSSAASLSATRGIARPGRFLDWYPESAPEERDFLQEQFARIVCRKRARAVSFSSFRSIAAQIEEVMEEVSRLTEAERRTRLADLRAALARTGLQRDNLVQAFAHVGVEVHELFGFTLHREQFFCGWVLMHGMLAEMATGEGKSITAALAAITAGLAGAPVHVITTNDYLVERDAASMQDLFGRFGLSSGFVTANQDDDKRRASYALDICYVSNKQVVFDYLRDRQQLGNRPSSISARVQALCRIESPTPLLRGLCFAIVDEADSVLIDDAITPLILSQQSQEEQDVSQSLTAISLARRLTKSVDFNVDRRARRVIMTERGEHQLVALASCLDGVWKNRRYRLELARQALSAIHLFERDRDYLVRDGEVVLVDQSTGRTMPDRKLQHGLHQMVETKEKCELTGLAETLSSLSFQNFFQRYKFLCGMTGTAKEAAGELRDIYRLGVVPVPQHQPSARIRQSPIFAVDEESHQDLVLTTVINSCATGRPVLVGTRSLAESERISMFFKTANINHQVLNARQDEEEARIVAKAGERGAVTIATNIAGRGTDIPIDAEVKRLGGLQVIVAELNDNQRIDRQLIGRGARQGDPGSFIYVISLSDEMLRRYLPTSVLNLLRNSFFRRMPFWNRLCLLVCRFVQNTHEGRQKVARRQASLADEQINRRLSFSGYKE